MALINNYINGFKSITQGNVNSGTKTISTTNNCYVASLATRSKNLQITSSNVTTASKLCTYHRTGN